MYYRQEYILGNFTKRKSYLVFFIQTHLILINN